LQQQRRFWKLLARKYTLEAPEFVSRYVRWFFVRVLRVKSLTGKRQEIASEQMKVFR